MKISLSTFVYYRYPLMEAIKRIAGYGYDAVEIWGGRPHAYFEDMDKKRISDTKKAIADNGLEISNFIPAQFRYPVNIAAPDERIRKNSIAYLRNNIDVAAALGSPYVSLCPGFGMYGQQQIRAWNCMIQSLRELADHAENTPVELLLEPGNRYETDLVVTVDDGIKAVCDLDKRMGLLPDTGHLFINHEPLADTVEKVKDFTCHFHIDDNMGVTDDHMVPGEGRLHFDIFLEKLKASAYVGALAVELGFQYTIDPDVAVAKSIDYLRKKMS
ncbi:MAG: TIM barrel protein [Proteobacteria bacterium]|nr:TIM barrel protein [Pseudomonadota bacterium]